MAKRSAERQESARERLDQALGELAESEQWKSWLATRAKFHRYSLNNTLLIAWQRPDATSVAGYNAWQDLGWQVRKGEKGIGILAPITVREKLESGEVDPDGRSYTRFRTVYVFDHAQTEPIVARCDDPACRFRSRPRYFTDAADAAAHEHATVPVEALPVAPPCRVLDTDSGLTDLSDALGGHALASGIEIAREDTGGRGNGYIDRATKRIVLGTHLGRDASIKTLIHELAHWHDLGTEGNYERADAEIVAESVAFVVADAYGSDTPD